MSDYAAIRDSVKALIDAEGVAMTLIRTTSTTFNEVTGTYGSTTPTEYPCSAVIGEYKTRQVDGTVIQRGDKQLFLSAPADMPEPTSLDKLRTAGGVLYQIMDCKPLAPAELAVMYEVQARRGA